MSRINSLKKELSIYRFKDYNRPLESTELKKYITSNNYRGWFCRDELENITPRGIESGILNFDLSTNSGTHWICWIKSATHIMVFDSYGTPPPIELENYLRKSKDYEKRYKYIYSNDLKIQPENTVICGHLSIFMINKNPKNLNDFMNARDHLIPRINKDPMFM